MLLFGQWSLYADIGGCITSMLQMFTIVADLILSHIYIKITLVN